MRTSRQSEEIKILKKIIFSLVFVLAVLAVLKITGDGWFWASSKLEEGSSVWKKKLPLQTVQISEKAKGSSTLSIKSEAAVVLDAKREMVLFEKNMQEQLPIASISTLMTALVFLETNPNLNDTATITLDDAMGAGYSQLKVRETFTLCDLLHASLMSSNNRTTRTLVRTCGLSYAEFINRMNLKATKIGLENTVFFEPTGLDTNNRSTALDCARLLYFAQRESLIASIMGKTSYQFSSLGRHKRSHQIRNTNKLLYNPLPFEDIGNVVCGKTGYNGPSGYCFSTLVQGEEGEQIIAVVLGAPSSGTRFKEIKSILQWSLQEEENKTPEQARRGG
jgi:D-alanyl-D-alanine endopeptidase (penicillin-binding protein 7)